ncbi:hypothetical protein DPMN_070017 [Dreissena polymorpha]|uniref:Uncharacterized protein n=1 Tax=Dreissena polymorpha TaxID=45954 RepID=A0A9D3Z0K5_DREPO|nr:hypothetical protein DPMN_070017 [Dreissena polymorpha]
MTVNAPRKASMMLMINDTSPSANADDKVAVKFGFDDDGGGRVDVANAALDDDEDVCVAGVLALVGCTVCVTNSDI